MNLVALAAERPWRKGMVGVSEVKALQQRAVVERRGPALCQGHNTVLFFSKPGIWAILRAHPF